MKTKHSVIAFAALLLLGACQETNKQGNETGSADTAVLKDHDNDKSTVTTNDLQGNNSSNAPAAWSSDGVDWKSPVVKYDEVKNKDVEVRGNDQYGIYSLDEKVLFDKDQSTLKAGAKEKLDDVIASIKQRYADARIGVLGFTDSTGTKDYNKALSEQRAEAVKQYLVQNGGMNAGKISVTGYGENRPAESNATHQGRMENRRVQIVARK